MTSFDSAARPELNPQAKLDWRLDSTNERSSLIGQASRRLFGTTRQHGLDSLRPAHRPHRSLPAKKNSALPEPAMGVLAVGDVRANSIKRVASAVGEGAIVVSLVHRTLAEL